MQNLTEIVKQLYAAFGRGDIQAILDIMAEDVELEAWADNSGLKANIPYFRYRTGKAGAAEFFGVVAQLKISEFKVLSIMEGGNQVAAEFVIEADVPGDGHYRDEEMHLWTFNEAGQVIRLRHYLDTAKHIEACRNWR